MKLNIKHILAAVGITSALLLSGCGEEKKETAKVAEPEAQQALSIKVGVIGGSEEQVAEVAQKIAKDKYNLDVELIIFNDYVTPNAALDEGSLDINAFQHQPYLDKQVEDHGYKIVSVANTFVYPIAAYSHKVKTVAELPEGAKIGVPNDPTNEGRALLLLQKQGIITLKEGVGLTATPLDIVSSDKNVEIVELEAPQLPRSLDDLDLAIINNSYAATAGLTHEKDGVFVEDKDSPYVNIIAAREDNKDAENVKLFIKAYQSDEVETAAKKIFGPDAVVKGW